jgi:hypothetical protein
MSVLDTKQPVSPLLSFSEQVLHPNEDNVCLSQRAFLDSHVNNNNDLPGSFEIKPRLETPKCSPKRTFKVKILKDDVNDDDPEVQYTGKNAIKIAEYEGKPFKMRKYHKSPSNKCGRSSKTVIFIPKTTMYSDGRKITTKVPLSVPSMSSVIKVVPLVSSAIKILSTGITEGLQEAHMFSVTDTNRTVVSFASEVFRCPDGSYSSSQSFGEVQSISEWFILLFILAVIVFTITINSYWPILLSIFRSIKNVLSKQKQANSNLQGVINRLDHVSRFSFSVKSPPSQEGSSSTSSVPSANSTSWGLWCWTFIYLA